MVPYENARVFLLLFFFCWTPKTKLAEIFTVARFFCWTTKNGLFGCPLGCLCVCCDLMICLHVFGAGATLLEFGLLGTRGLKRGK